MIYLLEFCWSVVFLLREVAISSILAIRTWSLTANLLWLLDQSWIKLLHEAVAHATHLRAVLNNFVISLTSDHLILCCYLIVRIVSCLVGSKTNWHIWDSTFSAHFAHLRQVWSSIIKVFYFALLFNLLILVLLYILFLVGISWTQDIGVLWNIWNIRYRIKISLSFLLLNVRIFIWVWLFTIVDSSHYLMIFLIEVKIVIIDLMCLLNVTKQELIRLLYLVGIEVLRSFDNSCLLRCKHPEDWLVFLIFLGDLALAVRSRFESELLICRLSLGFFSSLLSCISFFTKLRIWILATELALVSRINLVVNGLRLLFLLFLLFLFFLLLFW